MDWDTFLAQAGITPETVTVQPLEGNGAYGPVLGTAVAYANCLLDETRRLSRRQGGTADGYERTKSGTVVLGPPSMVAPSGSQVTLPSGLVSRVSSVDVVRGHGLDVPEHVELNLE